MDVNDSAPCLNARVVRRFFASKLAPTEGRSSCSPTNNNQNGELAHAAFSCRATRPCVRPGRANGRESAISAGAG
ncbi:hypothetical protein DOZ80_17495 [Pseudomonas fluorescens]|uniref:Uncharacterized protein n=1 Tax=Pseudomonas fluorescens TaxID=294 RepID=A0A327N212_PSEFL|nr:hypothetical protein DOZ80_17495 [Pseudomonas fluorescens]